MLRNGLLWLSVSLFLATAFAGCSGSDGPFFDPDANVPLTGNTVHLKMSVVDYNQTALYPGLFANMWAFCAEAFDPTDTYSVNAVHYYDALPTDAPHISEHNRATCSVPGPTIRVKQGDRVIVDFTHSHFHPHTIHWHGQYVDNQDDGVPGLTQQAVASGQSYTYDFIAKRPGTLWYHCHVDTQLHVMQGLYGMFIVDPQDTSHEPKADAEAIMVLGTATRNIVEATPGVPIHQHPPGCFTSGTPDCQNPPWDTTPDIFLINGHSFPYTEDQKQSTYHVDAGKTLRIRILNAGNTVEEIHLHGHDMLITHEDGLPLTNPYYVDTLNIGPAQRFDVLVRGDNPGVWAFHTHVNNHEANDEQVPGGMHTVLTDGVDLTGHDHAYPSELPGGVGYQSPAYIPGDVVQTQSYHFAGNQIPVGLPGPAGGATQQVDAPFSFPVVMPCSVKAVTVGASLSGTGAETDSLTVTIKNENGDVMTTYTLGRGTNPTDPATTDNRYERSGPGSDGIQGALGAKGGNWTVTISGTAAVSDLSFNVNVDHYGSFDEVKYLHRLDKRYFFCGKYGQGTDGLETQAPPP